MDDETKSKLEIVLQRKAQYDEEAASRQRAANAAAREKDAQNDAARERWQRSLHEIDAAVKAVNPQIAGVGLELAWVEKPRGSGEPGIAQLTISLAEQGRDVRKKLVFNVNALGLIQVVPLIPHSGRKVADFRIADVDQQHYEAVMVDFLDQCIAKPKPIG